MFLRKRSGRTLGTQSKSPGKSTCSTPSILTLSSPLSTYLNCSSNLNQFLALEAVQVRWVEGKTYLGEQRRLLGKRLSAVGGEDACQCGSGRPCVRHDVHCEICTEWAVELETAGTVIRVG